MADSSYPFPPDRFDDEADAVSFHGAHRAEEPFWRQNLVYIVIIAVALVTLLVLLFAIGGRGGDDRATEPNPSPSAEQTEESPEPSDGGGEETEEPLPEANKETTVTVINAGGINGLAGTWRDTLNGSGWTDVTLATADNRQEESVVYYREEADRGTAQALAEEVGAGEAQQSDEYDSPITFVAVTEPEAGGDGGGEG